MAGLWGDLSRTLARLETIAAEPEERLDDALEALPPLQYALHRTGELVVGIDPPPGAEVAHAELAAALSDARDATAEVLDAVETGGAEAAAMLVHEWRGALFRVRLARLRLVPPPEQPAPAPAEVERIATRAIAATLIGAIVVALGALLGEWPLAAGGLTIVACALLRRWA